MAIVCRTMTCCAVCGFRVSACMSELSTHLLLRQDNINLHLGGACDAEGICNLRDVENGEFVDFSVGDCLKSTAEKHNRGMKAFDFILTGFLSV